MEHPDSVSAFNTFLTVTSLIKPAWSCAVSDQAPRGNHQRQVSTATLLIMRAAPLGWRQRPLGLVRRAQHRMQAARLRRQLGDEPGAGGVGDDRRSVTTAP